MAVNNQQANDAKWMETITRLAEAAQNTSIKGVADVGNIIANTQFDAMALLKGMTEDIDKPILKSLANDMVGVLGSLYIDENALCCLIKNILMQQGIGLTAEQYREEIERLKKEKGFSAATEENVIFQIKELDFITYIDFTIAVIDIALIFLEMDLNDLVLPSLDFIREISEAAVGFLLIGMQQIIFTLRDSAIAWIIQEIEKNTSDVEWAKCLPYMDFMSVLKKYIHDYGLLAKLMAMFQGFMGDQHRKWADALTGDYVKNVKLIEFLRWIRDILNKIRNAILSWEFCLFISDRMDENDGTGSDSDNPYFNFLSDIILNPDKTSTDSLRPDYVFGDDNTILNNGGNQGNANNQGNGVGQNSINVPTNDEVKSFLINYMGITDDRANQLLGSGDKNVGDGNGAGTANSCGSVLNPSDLEAILDRYIQRSRIG